MSSAILRSDETAAGSKSALELAISCRGGIRLPLCRRQLVHTLSDFCNSAKIQIVWTVGTINKKVCELRFTPSSLSVPYRKRLASLARWSLIKLRVAGAVAQDLALELEDLVAQFGGVGG
jgi:hypothetical protein